jgi:hypothetical protein
MLKLSKKTHQLLCNPTVQFMGACGGSFLIQSAREPNFFYNLP